MHAVCSSQVVMSGLSQLKMSAFCMRQTGVANGADRDERAGVEAFGGIVSRGVVSLDLAIGNFRSGRIS